MTQLLISVKNVEEALIALDAGAEIIDLKDPSIGALGALDLITSEQIVKAINKRVILSSTVGEQHKNVSELAAAICAYEKIGVDIIKIAVNDLFTHLDFKSEINKLIEKKIKLVAVFFAEDEINWPQLKQISKLGFYGAMIDTKQKKKDITQIVSLIDLQNFTQTCIFHHLKSGLAGSLKLQHINQLTHLNPSYMGFRGGVCKDFERQSILIAQNISEIKKMLLKHNNFELIAQ